MNKQKGFTIIELIVVIAIIAVLAAIVLINVTQYINKGKDAAIKGNLGTMMTNGAVYFDTNSNYTQFSTNALYTVPKAAAESANGGTTVTYAVKATNDYWCACSILKVTSGNTYCVDSTGYKKETGTACGTRCTATTGSCAD
jgi:prepilin-type N-terminal cleavage/methylation domain-containing protein